LKNGSFIINGLASESVHAVITKWFDIPRPARKITLNADAVGADRAIIVDEQSYANREFEVTIGVWEASTNLPKLLNTLDSGGYIDARFYTDPDYTYQVISTAEITAERLGKSVDYREVTVKFSAAPYKYLTGVQPITVTNSTTVTNPASYAAKPLLTLTGTGDMTLTVNGHTISFKSIESEIALDCALQDAYREASGVIYNLNAQMSHSAYPTLKPGANAVAVTGAKLMIEPRWRTL
jgi:phage-related protein